MRGIDAVLQVLPSGNYDMQIDFDGDIKTEDAFDTFILVALLTDRRADASEIQDPNRRRGWIGNEHTPGFEMGSKLWLYEMARVTRTIVNEIEVETVNALQSLVDEDFAVAIRSADIGITTEGMTLEVIIERSPSRVEKRFFDFWQNTGA